MPELFANPVDLAGLIAGATATGLLLHRTVKWLMDEATKGIDLRPPEGIDRARWDQATSIPSEDAGKLLGRLESLLFFMSLWFGIVTIILGWLAFKVATKWEAWQNLIQVPRQLKDVDDLEYLAARHRWASYVFMRFLVGTVGNLLVAALGVAIGRLLIAYINGF